MTAWRELALWSWWRTLAGTSLAATPDGVPVASTARLHIPVGKGRQLLYLPGDRGARADPVSLAASP